MPKRIIITTYHLLLEPKLPAAPPWRARGTARELAAHAEIQLAFGDGEGALRTYSALLREMPDDARACGWRLGALRAVRLTASWPDDPRVWRATQDLARHIMSRRDGQCLARTKSDLFALVVGLHRDGQRTKLFGLYNLAARRYRWLLDDLKAFPRETYEFGYYYAELLFKLQRWRAAAASYLRVARTDRAGRYSSGALQAAEFCRRKAVERDGR